MQNLTMGAVAAFRVPVEVGGLGDASTLGVAVVLVGVLVRVLAVGRSPDLTVCRVPADGLLAHPQLVIGANTRRFRHLTLRESCWRVKKKRKTFSKVGSSLSPQSVSITVYVLGPQR